MFGLDIWLVWFLAGILVGTAEMAIPGFVIVFFGIGCWGAAVAAAIAPEAYTVQVAVFLVVSVVSLATLRKVAMNIFTGRSEDAQIIGDSSVESGTQIVVDDDFVPGKIGRVRYRGSLWYAKSATFIKAGADAVITGVDETNKSCLVLKPSGDHIESDKGEN